MFKKIVFEALDGEDILEDPGCNRHTVAEAGNLAAGSHHRSY